MHEVQMHPDDYVLWLKGMFDTLGDRMPTREEWDRLREQNVMQVGDVVMRRVEEREIAHQEIMRRAKEEEDKRKAYEQMKQMQNMYYAQQAQTARVAATPGTYENIALQLANSAMGGVNFSASAKAR